MDIDLKEPKTYPIADEEWPSVTTIGEGITLGFQNQVGLDRWKIAAGGGDYKSYITILKQTQERGKAIHKLAEKMVKNELLRGYDVRGYEQYMFALNQWIIDYNPLSKLKNVLIDIKSKEINLEDQKPKYIKEVPLNHAMQNVAYAKAWQRSQDGSPLDRLYTETIVSHDKERYAGTFDLLINPKKNRVPDSWMLYLYNNREYRFIPILDTVKPWRIFKTGVKTYYALNS